MNSKNERIKCPYCLSENVTVIEDKENSNGHFVGLCNDCGKIFKGYANPIDMTIKYDESEKCELGEVRRSSESYEQEIDRLKHEKEHLLLAIENLNKTIGILMDQIIREGYRLND